MSGQARGTNKEATARPIWRQLSETIWAHPECMIYLVKGRYQTHPLDAGCNQHLGPFDHLGGAQSAFTKYLQETHKGAAERRAPFTDTGTPPRTSGQ